MDATKKVMGCLSDRVKIRNKGVTRGKSFKKEGSTGHNGNRHKELGKKSEGVGEKSSDCKERSYLIKNGGGSEGKMEKKHSKA